MNMTIKEFESLDLWNVEPWTEFVPFVAKEVISAPEEDE